jgi:hypothetical protein
MSNENFWKKVSEGLNAQIKELAERRAINTAKYLNESHAAARKEMKNETLIERLKRVERYYFGEVSPLCREAIAEIERLEAEVKEHIVKIKDLEDFFVGSNHRVVKMTDELIREKIRLEDQVKELKQNWNNELRDQFACAAMEGILSAQGWHPEYVIPAGGGHGGGQRAADAVAEQAYIYADAMLKAREKK